MAPRQRSKQARQPTRSIGDLNDDLLERVFSFVPLKYRLRGAALVCTRWLAVCMRRNLLRSVCIRYTSETQMSACMWLARRAAAHVQQLRLEGGSQMMWMDVEDVDVHFSRQLGIVLAACTELSRLELYDPQVDLESSWASGSLAGLSEFCCHVSCIGNGTRMPGTLTRLQLQVHAEQLFQVSSLTMLTRLRDLELVISAENDLACLSVLTGLQRLSLPRHVPTPATLAVLTALTELVCDPILPAELSHVLPALPRLSRLRSLGMLGNILHYRLAGDWRTRLQRLEVTTHVLAYDQLVGASSLTRLRQLGFVAAMTSRSELDTDSLVSALRCAASLPSLSHLRLPPDLPSSMRRGDMQCVMQAALELQKRCPALTVLCREQAFPPLPKDDA